MVSPLRSCKYDNEYSGSIKDAEFLDYLGTLLASQGCPQFIEFLQ
jgi:hypothetical protein